MVEQRDFIKIKNLFENDVEKQLSTLKNIPWFYGVLSRKDAEKKVSMNGDFLLRLSNGSDNEFVLSLKWNGACIHSIIRNEIDSQNKEIIYYIVPKYKFNKLTELINFYVANQLPLSPSSEAVLCRGVCPTENSKKSYKFKKALHVSSKLSAKNIPRSGSVVTLGTQRQMSTFSEINKSLDQLSTAVISEPSKNSKRGFLSFANKLFQPRLRQSKINIDNDKYNKENSDNTGYWEPKCENGNVMQRDKVRRGTSLDAITTALLSFDDSNRKSTIDYISLAAQNHDNTNRSNDRRAKSVRVKKERSSAFAYLRRGSDNSEAINISADDTKISKCLNIVDFSGYLDPDNSEVDSSFTNTQSQISIISTDDSKNDGPDSNNLQQDISPEDGPSLSQNKPIKTLNRGHSSVYVVPIAIDEVVSKEKESPSTIVVPKHQLGVIETTSSIKRNESVYVVPLTPRSAVYSLQSSLTMTTFINLELSAFPLYSCGPVEGPLDVVAINRIVMNLLSHPNNPLALCFHLLSETRRIFNLASSNVTLIKTGYRCFFMRDSDKCQRDLSIRQSAFTCFVMATIVSTESNERRIQVITFWMKCADFLLTRTRDILHFRSLVTAILSDQISHLKVWKSVYRKDPLMMTLMQSFRKAISDNCFLITEIDQFIPDIVQLYKTFTCTDDDHGEFKLFGEVCFDIMNWSSQAFDDSSTWLMRITKELDYIVTIPFMVELVQTETLLSLIVGRVDIRASEVDPLLAKVEACIEAMAKARNH